MLYHICDLVSDKCKPVSVFQTHTPSGRAKFKPLGESGGVVRLEIDPAVEMSFLVEMVVDGGVNRNELL